MYTNSHPTVTSNQWIKYVHEWQRTYVPCILYTDHDKNKK